MKYGYQSKTNLIKYENGDILQITTIFSFNKTSSLKNNKGISSNGKTKPGKAKNAVDY
jgi:hypothetical protein